MFSFEYLTNSSISRNSLELIFTNDYFILEINTDKMSIGITYFPSSLAKMANIND